MFVCKARDELIADVDEQIEISRATHASDAAMSELYALRARLKAKRAQHKGE